MATEHETGQDRAFNGILIKSGKSTRKTHADWAYAGIRFLARRCLARAEHLALCFDLTVDFQSNRDDII
jgi:hypothetical protein